MSDMNTMIDWLILLIIDVSTSTCTFMLLEVVKKVLSYLYPIKY